MVARRRTCASRKAPFFRMHVSRIERKIERAHQKVLKAQERLAKLQVKLAHTPAGARKPNRQRHNPWVITGALAAIGWSGFPWQKVLDLIERALPAGSRPNPAPQPEAPSAPQTLVALPLPHGKLFKGVEKVLMALDSAATKIETRINERYAPPAAPVSEPAASGSPPAPTQATNGEFWTFGRRTRGG